MTTGQRPHRSPTCVDTPAEQLLQPRADIVAEAMANLDRAARERRRAARHAVAARARTAWWCPTACLDAVRGRARRPASRCSWARLATSGSSSGDDGPDEADRGEGGGAGRRPSPATARRFVERLRRARRRSGRHLRRHRHRFRLPDPGRPPGRGPARAHPECGCTCSTGSPGPSVACWARATPWSVPFVFHTVDDPRLAMFLGEGPAPDRPRRPDAGRLDRLCPLG